MSATEKIHEKNYSIKDERTPESIDSTPTMMGDMIGAHVFIQTKVVTTASGVEPQLINRLRRARLIQVPQVRKRVKVKNVPQAKSTSSTTIVPIVNVASPHSAAADNQYTAPEVVAATDLVNNRLHVTLAGGPVEEAAKTDRKVANIDTQRKSQGEGAGEDLGIGMAEGGSGGGNNDLIGASKKGTGVRKVIDEVEGGWVTVDVEEEGLEDWVTDL
ncbi:hypothetical protein MBLNU230_g1897t1 [Neophaeotheca triangularis]